MKNTKSELQTYLETGIAGSCDYAESIHEQKQDGMVLTSFDDSEVATGSNGMRVRREMMVDKRNFRVSSFFPLTTVTPTARLLEYIDLRDGKK